jgi:hypothetical protein
MQSPVKPVEIPIYLILLSLLSLGIVGSSVLLFLLAAIVRRRRRKKRPRPSYAIIVHPHI